MAERVSEPVDLTGDEQRKLEHALKKIAAWPLLVSVFQAPPKDIPFMIILEVTTPDGFGGDFDLTLTTKRNLATNSYRGGEGVSIVAKRHRYGRGETEPFLMNIDAEFGDPTSPTIEVNSKVLVLDGGLMGSLGSSGNLVLVVEKLADALYDPKTNKGDRVQVSLQPAGD